MLGAIIGDIIGSRYEFNPTNDYNFELFSDQNGFTDDTICTVAIADAILKGREYGESLHDWCRRYKNPKGGYGGSFRKWVESDNPKPYGSFGNGSAMRVSPVGMYFRNGDDVVEQAKLTAACTHNHPIGINGAQAVAWAIHCAVDSIGGIFTPKQLKEKILDIVICSANAYGFPNRVNLEDYKNRFDETCQGTVPPAFQIIVESNSFEDAIRRAVSLGADADTIGAIVGSIAEHIWGIPDWMKEKAMSYLPDDMKEVVTAFYKACDDQPDYKPKDKNLKQQEVLMLWKLGYGHMGKYFNGENPSPSKEVKATKESWKIEPMPKEDVVEIEIEFSMNDHEMAIIRQGHIPEAQEDHWFMYCDDEYIRYYRSWTGTCSFEAHYTKANGKYIVDRLIANKALSEFGINGDIPAKWLFIYLICSEITGTSHESWSWFFQSWKDRIKEVMEYKEEEDERDKENFEAIKKCEEIYINELMAAAAAGGKRRITPAKIDKLDPDEVFVFGSNKAGHHHGGAARAAVKRFGAKWGQGDGLQGQSYAISTMDGLVEMAKNINRFLKFANEHKELGFYVTPIGCGKAGYTPEQIAPLFRQAVLLPNVVLPKSFWEYFWKTEAALSTH